MSYGSEYVPVQCVNVMDTNFPEYLYYSTQRRPTKGVNLNLDDDFLVGCDCTDDCQVIYILNIKMFFNLFNFETTNSYTTLIKNKNKI